MPLKIMYPPVVKDFTLPTTEEEAAGREAAEQVMRAIAIAATSPGSPD